jgi:hypothetical protein
MRLRKQRHYIDDGSPHYVPRSVRQSIFTPAVRERELGAAGNLARTGGLKMDRTKPLHCSLAYGDWFSHGCRR